MNRLTLDVLSHIRTYGLTVAKAVANVFDLGDESIAVELLEDLRNQGFVGKAQLTAEEDYYHLEARAAEVLQLEKVKVGPINGTPKVVAYGTLYFCCMEDVYRPLIPSAVFRTRFPELYRPGPHINYYTEGRKLGYIRVEHRDNTSGDVFRLIERCWKDIQQRTHGKKGPGLPVFTQLVDDGRFVITVLTAFEWKVKRIEETVRRLEERYRLYRIRAADIAQHGENYKQTPKPAFLEYQKWHHEAPNRPPPRKPPPIDARAIPGLLDLIFPKPVAIR